MRPALGFGMHTHAIVSIGGWRCSAAATQHRDPHSMRAQQQDRPHLATVWPASCKMRSSHSPDGGPHTVRQRNTSSMHASRTTALASHPPDPRSSRGSYAEPNCAAAACRADRAPRNVAHATSVSAAIREASAVSAPAPLLEGVVVSAQASMTPRMSSGRLGVGLLNAQSLAVMWRPVGASTRAPHSASVRLTHKGGNHSARTLCGYESILWLGGPAW